MVTFAKKRTARKARRCDGCGGVIPAGATYVRHSAPPGGDLGNSRWWTINACGVSITDCRQPLETNEPQPIEASA